MDLAEYTDNLMLVSSGSDVPARHWSLWLGW